MDIKFQKYTAKAEGFFKILPKEWQQVVRPIWSKEYENADIYVLIANDEIISGGIVFKGLTPDMYSFEKEAVKFVNAGYYYIGYLWVVESRRGENLGSFWLDSLKIYYSKTNFWLAIEDEKLKKFYLKNGFKLIKESNDIENKEWLFLFKVDE
tara:strand:- start:934 stop:1392 length:459 start_codon:yes stop_codon:yes gene_type:complete